MITRRLALVFTGSFGGTVSFYLLLSVVPLYATSVGAGDIGAGFTTATLMLATVAAELATPRLIARLGYRTAFALGLVLLGLPALALAWSDRMAVILVVCLIRGVGFAIVAVIGSAIVAILVPPERRGEGLGLYGIVVGIPSVVALPLGVWLATHIGFTVVFVAGAGIAVAGLLAVHSLPGKAPAAEDSHGIMAGLRNPLLLRPAIIFAATTMATGIVVTFLPVVTGGIAPFALLAQAASATAARWLAGKHADRHGPAGLLLPGVVVSALGMLTLVFVSSPVAHNWVIPVAGMLVFGVGFGIAQAATLTLMFNRVPASAYGTASAVWNLAYDTGMGVGAAGFGLVAAQTGYPVAFGLSGVVVLAAVLPALRDARASKTALGSHGISG